MAATSLRDRLFTRKGARAITSPVGVVGGVAVAVAAAVAGLPLWAALVVGLAVWALNALRLLPRGRRPERIDPFTLNEPWRRFVQDALQARTRFAAAVRRTPPGPLRDRLDEIGQRMQTGVEECWLVAKRGQALVTARRGIDLGQIDRQLARFGQADGAGRGDAGDPARDAVTQSLQVQRSTAVRLDGVIDRAQAELRLLDARLDEAVARTLELSAHASTEAGAASGLGTDVDNLVSEMESLRLALEETGAVAQGGTGPEPPPRDLPPGGPR
jgi:hypothetical protein